MPGARFLAHSFGALCSTRCLCSQLYISTNSNLSFRNSKNGYQRTKCMHIVLVVRLVFSSTSTLCILFFYCFTIKIQYIHTRNLLLSVNLESTAVNCSKKDLGLERYDPATLFEKLLTPATFMILAVMQLRVFQPHFLKLISFDEYSPDVVDKYVREMEERSGRDLQVTVTVSRSAPGPLDMSEGQSPQEEEQPLPSGEALSSAAAPVAEWGTPPQEAPEDDPLVADENTKDKTVYIGQYTFTIESGARFF